ncbi:MAG: hypothetical protein HQL12_02290 [Candidatus Omnitrophica bacterium]|nr:hypothetical protein [Candidatus Omnitrophota bacterium]
MKTKLILILGGLLLATNAAISLAATVTTTLTVQATVPAATGLSLSITPYTGNGTKLTTSTVTTTGVLDFGILTYNPATGTYGASNTTPGYFAIDIGTTGGAGTPIVAVTYVEGTNLNGASSPLGGLGTKTTATFFTETYTGPTTNPTEALSSLGKKRLIDLTGTAGQLSTIPSGAWERIYLGLWTGSSTASPADPSNGKPFTNADAGGQYTGTLTFTSTL